MKYAFDLQEQKLTIELASMQAKLFQSGSSGGGGNGGAGKVAKEALEAIKVEKDEICSELAQIRGKYLEK